MAALDFPLVPNTESEVTTGDITWKWNGYAWYATSQAGDVFLSKVTDDTAAGLITFEKGVSVTGGDPNTIGTGIVKDGANLDIINSGILCFQAYANGGALFGQTTADTGSLDLSYSGGDVNHTVSNLYGLREQLVFNAGASITDAFSFYASALNNGGHYSKLHRFWCC